MARFRKNDFFKWTHNWSFASFNFFGFMVLRFYGGYAHPHNRITP